MRRRLARSSAARLAFALALLGACSDGDGPGVADADEAGGADDGAGDAPAEVAPDAAGAGSHYRLTVHTQEGTEFELDRDLTGNPIFFSFGSTHIAPAVSFTVTDNITAPFRIITFNFGIVVGSDSFPVQCDGPGVYPFQADPPALEVFTSGLQYNSFGEGASGQIELTAWSVLTGDTFAGTFAGRLVQDVDKAPEDKRWIDVEGSFVFTLPERE